MHGGITRRCLDFLFFAFAHSHTRTTTHGLVAPLGTCVVFFGKITDRPFSKIQGEHREKSIPSICSTRVAKGGGGDFPRSESITDAEARTLVAAAFLSCVCVCVMCEVCVFLDKGGGECRCVDGGGIKLV